MGVDAIVIVENSLNISLDEFAAKMQADNWGRFAWRDGRNEEWCEFEREGKRYFSWLHTPRVSFFNLHEGDEIDSQDMDQISLLKTMLAVEKIAGGPVLVGNDIMTVKSPERLFYPDEVFFLPPELNCFLPNWRDAAKLDVIDT